MSTIPQLVKDARAAMDKALESSRKEFSSIRSGKASTTLLDTIREFAFELGLPPDVRVLSRPETVIFDPTTPIARFTLPLLKKYANPGT